jgi:hypothetical protein
MKTAHEIFLSSVRQEIGDFYVRLDEIGPMGQLAKHLLRCQRNGDREHKAAQHPEASPYEDYLRLMHSRNEFAITGMRTFCTEEENVKLVTIRKYSYGLRVKIRNYPFIRFRHIDNRWKGDESNLQPICELCDRLMTEAHDGNAQYAGKLFSWPPAV